MIPQRSISLLANRLAKAGRRRIPESVLERDYCLAWFLAELSQSELHRRVAFKGSTALKRCYFSDYRFSEDLDFTLLEPMPLEQILQGLAPIYMAVRDASGIEFAFDREDRQGHANSHTFYLNYAGPLPASGGVKVDVTISEHLVFPLEDRRVLRGYDEFADLPENRAVLSYSLGEIASEKVIALGDRARNEPRDLYDLWYLTAEEAVNLASLLPAIGEKLKFRGKPTDGLQEAILNKETRLKALWSARLGNQIAVLPPFENVFREFRRTMRQARLR